jgi:integrase
VSLFRDVLDTAKVTGGGYSFHSWRHTFRTRLSEAGVSDDLAKRLGGWTEDATAARYDHAERVEELRAAVEKAK